MKIQAALSGAVYNQFLFIGKNS